ncbi:MAG: 3-phosphoglycerate dehydrogenase family protein [Firmicutes bacterium]|nr:3-phosphoglycerate dehydrogenase family protein [Bacillota bacterium]
MPNILLFNKIAKCGLDQFPADYVCGEAVEAPAAIMVRSASLLDYDFDPATLAVARAGAGYNNVPVDVCTAKGICVFNTPGANANGVKELVIMGLFLASRKVAEAIDWCKGLKGQGAEVGKLVEKGKGAYVGPEILGKTLGLIGVGAIGGLVANAAAALGMDVAAYDPYISDAAKAKLDPGVKLLASAAEVAAVSDYLSLHAPLNAETKGSVNAAFLAGAKDGIRIVNTARADLVNSADLLAALESGKVAAYVVDFPTDEMIGVPGVTAIPHLGASTPESEDNCAIMAAKQLTAYIERGEIVNSVNLPKTELPASFEWRKCIIHDKALVIESSKRDFVATYTRGDIAYTVIDTTDELDDDYAAAYVNTMSKEDGVLKVRVLKG